MKKFALAFLSITMTTALFSQTLFNYGKQTVSKEEFLNAFNKNPNTGTDRKASLKEYLDLYTNFKLKVQAAYDDGLEKDATQQYELQNFRRQIADNIINEQANVKEMVKEAFARSQKEILLAQVFIEVPAESDTTEAYKKIQEAYKDLQAGKKFEEIAKQYSNDAATQQNKGDLGYITAFSLSYRLENIIYSLPVNTFSAPFKTKLGYHIFKNAGERKPLGSRKVAQIMIAVPPNSSAAEITIAEKKADSVYSLILKGEPFGRLAAAISNDLSSNNNNGELPEFTTGTYSPDFENAAFALSKTGQLTKPFQTAFGFHILKLIEAKEAPKDINDPTTFAIVQEKVVKDNRMEQAKKNLINKTLATIKYKPAVYKENDLFSYVDSAQEKKEITVKGLSAKTVIFSFTKQNVKAEDFANYVMSARNGLEEPVNYKSLLNQYVNVAADEYYRNHMEDYNVDFAKQVKEFKDANLLFAIMEKKVWGKANGDSTGLQQYYAAHKEKYQWPASADALIITANNEQLSDTLQMKMKQQMGNWREITSKYDTDVIADSGRYELSQLPVVDRTNFSNGLFTAPVKNENDGSYTFNYIFNLYKDPSQRSFEDARGMVISDYQQILEDKWIAELKKKYPVVVNQTVFQTIK